MSEDSGEIWLHTDETEEFIGALEFAAEVLLTVDRDRARWRWLIIAIHSAVQGACVCALRGADPAGISVLENGSRRAMWHYLDVESRINPDATPPEQKLATMLELYRRTKNGKYLPNPLSVDKQRDWNICKLNSLRNEFIHFVLQGLSLELSGMPQIAKSCCHAIRHLAIEYPTFSHHFNAGDQDRIARALSCLEDNANRLSARS